MPPGSAWIATAIGLALVLSSPARAQGRTDVVRLANGDRITGEVSQLERGRLEFKTDDAGTLYLEWDNVVSVVSARLIEISTSDGRTFLGSLQPAADRFVAVAGGGDTVQLPMAEVTLISQIGRGFWSKLDGSIDAGFSYTKSSEIAQLNVNSDLSYRGPRFEGTLTASLTATGTDDDDDDEGDDRGAIEASFIRVLGPRWYAAAIGRLDSNESLGLEIRAQGGGIAGIRTVNSNRAQVSVAGGVVVNVEKGVDVESTKNVEALAVYRASYYTYDRPRTNLDLTAQYYAGVSDTGRHRVQFDASARRELVKDLFLAVTLYDTFDSRPPSPDADRNDIGLVLSVGWSF